MHVGNLVTRSVAATILVVAAQFLVGGDLPRGPAVARAQSKVANPHGSYREDCSLCHSARGWKPVRISKKFDHEKFGVPLRGAHASVTCEQCHGSLDFAMVSAACVDCHADVHTGEFGTDCGRCHGTRSFIDRHDQVGLHRLTRLPLAGAHKTLDCEMCHRLAAPGAMRWVNTPTACEFCHTEEYLGTSNPDHVTAGFSRDCATCHDELTWRRANFDHAGTAFPLTGAHQRLACERCHIGGVFTGLSPACVSCHRQDYDSTTDPNHAATGFSTNCITCHNTTGWAGARFDHAPWFPIYAGAHNGKWRTCADCHVNSASFAEFSCFGCHPHSDQAKTDGGHQGVNGYSYDSPACYRCHPNGRK